MVKKFMYTYLMVWNKIVFTVLYFVLCNCLLAQSTVDQILRQVINDNRLSNVEQQLSYYRSNSFKSPALRELELRIRGNNLDSSPDNYSLRLGILNPRERMANNLFDIAKEGYLVKTKEYLLNEIFSEKYQGLINYYDLVKSRALMLEEKRQIKA